MNSIRLLTPFERGQAAYAEALSHVDYPADSDALLQWGSGLCSALLLAELADTDTGAGTDAADTSHLPVGLQVAIASTRHYRRQAQQFAAALQQMADELAPVLLAHLRGDGQAGYQALTVFAAQRCTVVDHSAGRGVLQ